MFGVWPRRQRKRDRSTQIFPAGSGLGLDGHAPGNYQHQARKGISVHPGAETLASARFGESIA
jgi:hypothetical protein